MSSCWTSQILTVAATFKKCFDEYMWNCHWMRFKFQLMVYLNTVRLLPQQLYFQFVASEWNAFNFDGIQFCRRFVYEHFVNYEYGRRLSNERWQVNCTNWNAIWRPAFCAFRSGKYNINKYGLCSHPFHSQCNTYEHTHTHACIRRVWPSYKHESHCRLRATTVFDYFLFYIKNLQRVTDRTQNYTTPNFSHCDEVFFPPAANNIKYIYVSL